MKLSICASALNAPSHSARHRTSNTPASGQKARSVSYVKSRSCLLIIGLHAVIRAL